MTTFLARSRSAVNIPRPFHKRLFSSLEESLSDVPQEGSPSKKQKITESDSDDDDDDGNDELSILDDYCPEIDSDRPPSPSYSVKSGEYDQSDEEGEPITVIDDSDPETVESDGDFVPDEEDDYSNNPSSSSDEEEEPDRTIYWNKHTDKEFYVSCDQRVPMEDEYNTEHYPRNPSVPVEYLRKAIYHYGSEYKSDGLPPFINLTEPKSLIYRNRLEVEKAKRRAKVAYVPTSIPVEKPLEEFCKHHSEQFFDAREIQDNQCWASDPNIPTEVYAKFVDSDTYLNNEQEKIDMFNTVSQGLPLEKLTRVMMDGSHQPSLKDMMDLKDALDAQVEFLRSFQPIATEDNYDGKAETYLKKARVESGALIRNPTVAGITAICQTLFGIKCETDIKNFAILEHIQAVHSDCMIPMPSVMKTLRDHTQTAFDCLLGGANDRRKSGVMTIVMMSKEIQLRKYYGGAIVNEALNFVANTIPAEICYTWSDFHLNLRDVVKGVADRWEYIKRRMSLTPKQRSKFESWLTDVELFLVNPEALDVGYSVISPIENINDDDIDLLQSGHDNYGVIVDADLESAEGMEECVQRLRLLEVGDFTRLFESVKDTLSCMLAVCNRGLNALFRMAAINLGLINDSLFMCLAAYGRIIQLLDTWSYRFNPSRLRQLTEKDYRCCISGKGLFSLYAHLLDVDDLPLSLENERTISCLKFVTSQTLYRHFSNYDIRVHNLADAEEFEEDPFECQNDRELREKMEAENSDSDSDSDSDSSSSSSSSSDSDSDSDDDVIIIEDTDDEVD
jgi:hypothetical protein